MYSLLRVWFQIISFDLSEIGLLKDTVIRFCDYFVAKEIFVDNKKVGSNWKIDEKFNNVLRLKDGVLKIESAVFEVAKLK